MVPRNNEQTYLLPKTGEEEVPQLKSVSSCYISKLVKILLLVLFLAVTLVIKTMIWKKETYNLEKELSATGPYKLVERQEGEAFWDAYSFYDGEDSLGSAGYNTYVSKERAVELGIISTIPAEDDDQQSLLKMESAVNPHNISAPRSSIRLEGKRRYNRGLFILNIKHMPTGCGVWPAFWLTDESVWPDHGEIDILEGINTQATAKTALHTRESCSMYAHVPDYAKTGIWDRATGIPNTWTGEPDYETSKEADNCWASAPHQWYNQGCVATSSENNTSLGEPVNEAGGGVYALEWDPANGYIKSWVFSDAGTEIPSNIHEAMLTASLSSDDRILPDTESWGLPYAYFAIGPKSGCAADHFQNMRLVFNLAFCGTVAGNRFAKDCPDLAQQYDQDGDSWASCNAYVKDNAMSLDEAYWLVNGVYVYEREVE